MADFKITQPTFTGGELSPELYGRKDLARYQVGVRRLNNMIVHATGGSSNRAGLRFVGEVKDHSVPGRLMTFEAAGDDAFLLVWGHQNVRPVAFGAFINNGGVPYEITTPYSAAQLPDVYMEQSNDVATITHPGYAPRELSRFSALNWTLTTVSFASSVPAPGSVAATTTQGYTGYGADKLPLNYTYRVATIAADGEESLPSSPATTNAPLVFGYEQNYVTITYAAAAGADSYAVYKANNGVYGLIGTTPNLSFRDDYIAPDFTSGPQDGYNPFASGNNYPSIVFFSQQRRGFAATNNRPQTIWMTQSGNFKNMSRRTPSRDDDAIEFTLAAQKKQDIFHVLSMERGLIVFTRSGEWKVTGRDGDIITPSSQLPEPQSQYGAARHIKPLVIGETMLFVGRDSRTVYEMEYSFEIDRYTANDMNLLAKHLFRGRRMINWAHAADPDGIIWCVMNDGKLLSLTYLKEHDVWGWGTHETRGVFLDVAVVPEGGRDVPYFLIRRKISGSHKVYIEMLERRRNEDIRNAFFVDCGLSYDVPFLIFDTSLGATTRLRIDDHGFNDGDEIEVDLSSYQDQQDEYVGTLDGRYLVSVVDEDWIELSHARIGAGQEIGDPVDSSALIGSYETLGLARRCVNMISGLDHLEGREVVILADGFVIDAQEYGEPIIVTGGALPTLQRKYARIHVGLPYRSTLCTLDLLNTQTDDNGVLKTAGPVYVRLQDTRGVKVGMEEDGVVELHSREAESYYDPPDLKNGSFQIEDGSGWDRDIPIWFVQDYPLPMTILGVTIDYAYGGDGSG